MVQSSLSGKSAGLYVDLNGVIHPLCHGPAVDDLSEEEKIKNILLYLENLIELVKPTSVLYLAADGVAPRAKINQQRARRYMSAAGASSSAEKKFDPNAISPGTLFMDRVTKAIQGFIHAKLEEKSPLWGGLSIILSDSNVPSEGEHKIIQFLRSQRKSSSFFSDHNVIVGLDADLILLSLELHVPRIVLMREIRKRQGNKPITVDEIIRPLFEYFSIDVVGESIVTELYELSLLKKYKSLVPSSNFCPVSASGYRFDSPRNIGRTETVEGNEVDSFHPCTCSFNSKIVDDFMVITFLVGNDFISRLPSSHCGESALDHLLECYIDDVLPYGFLTLGRGELSLPQLSRLFQSYARFEELLFLSAKHSDFNLLSCESKRESFNVMRETYYRSIGILDETMDEMCRAYLQTLAFIARYYTGGGEVDWRWFYPFHHSPLACDVHRFLERTDLTFSLTPAVENKPCDKMVQLLSILPPPSAGLIPAACQALLEISESNPHVSASWKVDYTGVKEDHMATVILPFVNLQHLEAQFEPIKKKLGPNDALLNTNSTYHFLFCAEGNNEAQHKAPEFLLGEKVLLDTKDGVLVYHYREEKPTETRPMVYSHSAPLMRSYSSWNTFALSTKVELIDFVIVLFLTLEAFFLFSGHPFLAVQVVSLSAFVALTLYALGIAATIPSNFQSASIYRFQSRNFFLNWICCGCKMPNFQRQKYCFFCSAPFDAKLCKAFFSSKYSQSVPLLYQADHRGNMKDFSF